MTNEERSRVLAMVPEFRNMPSSALATLAAAMREELFHANETLVTVGERGDRIFVLCEGALEVARPHMPGVRRLERGALLGELAFFTENVRTATVTAKTDSVLLSLAYENFRAFLLAYPECALSLTRRIARQLHQAEEELAALIEERQNAAAAPPT
jgi:CRP-like cAMP-binding protein